MAYLSGRVRNRVRAAREEGLTEDRASEFLETLSMIFRHRFGRTGARLVKGLALPTDPSQCRRLLWKLFMARHLAVAEAIVEATRPRRRRF
jgi:hypothetical protein